MCLFHGIQKNVGLIHLFMLANERGLSITGVPMALLHSSLMASLPLMCLLLLTLNVNGLRCANKTLSFIHWLHSLNHDFICLQELHFSDDAELLSWFSSSGFSIISSPGSVKSAGVAILYRPRFTLSNSWKDDLGRFIMGEFKVNDSVFRVANIYAPNRNPSRNLFFEDISSVLDPSVSTLLAGDFNSVLDRSLDRRGSSSFSSSSRESSDVISKLFSDLCVIDAWRHFHPDESSFSWTRPDGAYASRIDLIGCPSDWLPFASASSIFPCPYSDHDVVSLTFSVPASYSRGPGFWKLNISILEDPEYISLIRAFWSSWRDLKPSYHTLQNWWDVGKFKIKQITIRFCSDRAKRKRSRRTELTAKAASLKREVDNGRVSVLDEYNSVLSELSSMDLEDARGAQVHSRARWCEEGESSSSFFFRLEKKRSKDNWISSVCLPDKSCVSELPDLMVAWSSFYKDLFTSVDTDPSVQSDLLDNLQSVLSPQEADLCEGSLSVDEALVALKGMAKRKTPGSDGFPMEFYVQFWDILGEDLVNVLNRAYSAGVLTTSQRRGLISLLFKKGDCLERANWRPITLLNVDYKIASRSVAGRLLKVIHSNLWCSWQVYWRKCSFCV